MMNKIKDLFGRTNRTILISLVLLLVSCATLSVLVPPFQSPDEYDHIKRAYLLARGKIVLDHPMNQSSGGMIDSGLTSYMTVYSAFSGRPDRKVSADVVRSAELIQWSGTKVFSPAPGTGFYFPLIYAPQAIGLSIGRRLGCGVDASYRLARAFTLVTSIAIILIALSIYPANPLVLVLLILPMSLFQFSSASLDAVSTAMSIFCIAAFLRIALDRTNASPSLLYALTACVLLLATSRTHLLPLALLVLMAGIYMGRKKEAYLLFGASTALVIGWLLIAIKTTIDLRVANATPTFEIIRFYLTHPVSFLDVMVATLANPGNLLAYRMSFIGILGWLDTYLSEQTYRWLTAAVALIGLMSISWADLKANWTPRATLIALSLVSMLLIFFALLVTWTVHPAKMINGVQGRYFLVPLIMIAYGVAGPVDLHEGVVRKAALGMVAAVFMYVIVDTTAVLLNRYYIAPVQPAKAAQAAGALQPSSH